MFPCSSWTWRSYYGSSHVVQGHPVVSVHVSWSCLPLNRSHSKYKLPLDYFSPKLYCLGGVGGEEPGTSGVSILYPAAPSLGIEWVLSKFSQLTESRIFHCIGIFENSVIQGLVTTISVPILSLEHALWEVGKARPLGLIMTAVTSGTWLLLLELALESMWQSTC